MSRFLILIPLLALAGCGFEAASAQQGAAAFPESWAGHWKGQLEVAPYEGEVKRLPMELTVAKKEQAGHWRFAIQYGGQPLRDYELITEDRKKGRYRIDERNSIVLPAWYTGGELVSIFSLSGQLLTARYQRIGDEIHFSILVTKTSPTSKTGGEGRVPVVGAHLPATYQRARLKRTSD